MGEVYLVYDTTLHRFATVKILRQELGRSPDQIQRFERQVLAASRLNHPNILTVYETGSEQGFDFIATEYIEGEPLSVRLAQGRLSIRQALNVAIQVASALCAAHQAGIVHGDIKPENILLRGDGLVKVLDFGSVNSLQSTRSELETQSLTDPAPAAVRYMSPEQARGSEVDARSDIFSLGAVIHEMVTGRSPFDAASASDSIAAVLAADPPADEYPPDTPPEIQSIVRKALAKDPDQRYQKVEDLEGDLKNLQQRLLLDEQLKHTDTVSLAPRRVPFEPKHRAIAYISTAVLLGIIAWILHIYLGGPPAIDSLAVLPFANTTGDPNIEYLSDGISGTLADNLSQLQQLKVIALNSTLNYKGKIINAREVGKALGASAVLTGKFRQQGNDIEIYTELIDAQENTEIWGEHFRRKPADLQEIEQQIARAVAQKLSLRLTGAQQQQLAKRPTSNPRAYQLYLRALFYSRSGGWSGESRSLRYLEEAVALDPNFALAYAKASVTYTNLATALRAGLDSREALARAKSDAEKAMSLDPTLAEAHGALAVIRMNEWNWTGAEAEFERALELNPSLAATHGDYAPYLAKIGHDTEALAENRRAQQLDPLNIRVRAQRGFILMLARRFDEAIDHLKQILVAHPGSRYAHEYLGLSYAGKGSYPEAISEYQKFINLDEGYPFIRALLAHAYGQSGQKDQALAILADLKNGGAYVSPVVLAVAYVGLDQKDPALESLEQGWTTHDNLMQYLKSIWVFDPLRPDARFQQILHRMSFPD